MNVDIAMMTCSFVIMLITQAMLLTMVRWVTGAAGRLGKLCYVIKPCTSGIIFDNRTPPADPISACQAADLKDCAITVWSSLLIAHYLNANSPCLYSVPVSPAMDGSRNCCMR